MIVRGSIERLSWRGHGVLPVEDGRWLEVPGTAIGEVVEVAPDGRRGRLLRVLEPAPERVDPGCDQSPGCPGCPLRHLSAEARAAAKLDAHRATLARLADLPAVPSRLISPAPLDGYRARARARPQATPTGIVLGMRAHPGSSGVDLTRCPAQTDGTRALLRWIESTARQHAVPWSLEPDTPGLIEVEVEGDLRDGRVRLLCSAPTWDAIFCAALPSGVQLYRQVMGNRGPGPAVHLAGPPHVEWRHAGRAFRVTAPAWRPHSPHSVTALGQTVLDLLQLAPDHRLLDIGCGVGTLSLDLAARCAQVLGIDIERAAVQDASVNAQAHGIDNAIFQVGDAAHVTRRLLRRGRRFDRVLVHMMRRPLTGATLRQMSLLGARRLVYLAPSVASFARDLAERGPWRVEQVVFIDQLPGTVHLLSAGVLTRDG